MTRRQEKISNRIFSSATGYTIHGLRTRDARVSPDNFFPGDFSARERLLGDGTEFAEVRLREDMLVKSRSLRPFPLRPRHSLASILQTREIREEPPLASSPASPPPLAGKFGESETRVLAPSCAEIHLGRERSTGPAGLIEADRESFAKDSRGKEHASVEIHRNFNNHRGYSGFLLGAEQSE